MDGSKTDISVRTYPLNNLPLLQQHWQALEQKSQASFFLSWHWIGCWLRVFKPTAIVVEARLHDELLGLGILCQQTSRRRLFRKEQLLLQQTGQLAQDQIWIEYNDFLLSELAPEATRAAMIACISAELTDWDEWQINGLPQQQCPAWLNASGLSYRLGWEAPCYAVDLVALRASGKDYLDTLSGNTRYQIRRAIRVSEQQGKLQLEQPNSLEQALGWWQAIKPWHLQRFGANLDGSGFANPDFLAFHQTLITDNWPQGSLELHCLKAGEQVLGYFYNFIHRQRVYFYLAGLAPVADKQQKPGLVGHSLLIAHYAARGLDCYDFMAGDARYKAQLGRNTGKLCQLILQRDSLSLRLEQLARRIKGALKLPQSYHSRGAEQG
ncbi:hypothetical protein AEST_30330 [Alishewanella aestuarii B11]|uniref:BioF2-like acetyltransferase domain-containing protein n=2 Tax=Alishewanella aestuarii TaxID=453835 RepID=J2IC03_9ALTE|nr:hypothetical protein AEST_30330 [Alishewanella aestuarii B11]